MADIILPEYNYIPKYIRQTVANKPKDVITATRWNELFNLLITQGDYTAEELGNILNHFTGVITDLAEDTHNMLEAVNTALATLRHIKQDKLIAGQNITIAADGKTISANDDSASWGNISGNLQDQADLYSILESIINEFVDFSMDAEVAIAYLRADKQDKLIAGEGITISEDGKTISATGGGAGVNGATFIPSVDVAGNISWTNDKGLPNPTTRNIRGQQGPKGDTGATGAQGPKGDQGATGPKGDTGATGPQGEQGPPGQDGYEGPPGADGNVIIVDNTLPSTADRNEGDIFINSVTFNVYKYKAEPIEDWILVGNIKGAAGQNGADGTKWHTGNDYPASAQVGDLWLYTGLITAHPDGYRFGDVIQYCNVVPDIPWEVVGNIKGADGAQGPKGETGAVGPQGLKGDTGATGATGPRGPQGPAYTLTAADKQSIVDDVLAALPNGDEVSY